MRHFAVDDAVKSSEHHQHLNSVCCRVTATILDHYAH